MSRRLSQLRARLGALLARLDRRPAIHWLVLQLMPRAVTRRFDATSAQGLEATLELTIRHPLGRSPARFELAIAGGSCQVTAGPAASPGARAALGSDDLIRLASGAASWPELFSSGRFELTGDPFLALRFASLFRMPVALEPIS